MDGAARYELSAAPSPYLIFKYIDRSGNEYLKKAWCYHPSPFIWDKCDEDMRDLSLAFPFVIFSLYREGEKPTDTLLKCYQNGKVQRC